MKDMTEQIYDELNAQVVRMLNHSLAQASRIADLERQLSEHKAARIAYASEFQLDKNGDPDVGNIHANIRALKAQLAEASVPAVAQQPFGYVATLTSPGGTIFHWSRVVREKRDADACAKQWEANGKVGVAALYTAPQAADTDKLREAISKIPTPTYSTIVDRYEFGFGAGLKAASDLIATTAGQAPVREVPETHKLVPIRPNWNMLDALYGKGWIEKSPAEQVGMVQAYRNMLDAAALNLPAAPVQQEGDRG